MPIPTLSVLTLILLSGIAPTPERRVCPGADFLSAIPRPYADPFTAVPKIEALRRLHPSCVELDIAAAREGAAAGVLDTTREARRASLEGAVAAARAALADDSTRADTHYWLAATLGLEADITDGRSKISFAREAYTQAERALEIDSLQAGAHHVIGRLHWGAKHLSRINRLIARALGLGAVLHEASWQSAEYHLRLAARLDPRDLVNQVELAKFLMERGERKEGRRILQAVAARTPENPLDAHYVREAQRLLSGRGDVAWLRDGHARNVGAPVDSGEQAPVPRGDSEAGSRS